MTGAHPTHTHGRKQVPPAHTRKEKTDPSDQMHAHPHTRTPARTHTRTHAHTHTRTYRCISEVEAFPRPLCLCLLACAWGLAPFFPHLGGAHTLPPATARPLAGTEIEDGAAVELFRALGCQLFGRSCCCHVHREGRRRAKTSKCRFDTIPATSTIMVSSRHHP